MGLLFVWILWVNITFLFFPQTSNLFNIPIILYWENYELSNLPQASKGEYLKKYLSHVK